MLTAFVLIKIAAGKETKALEELMKVSEIEGIRLVFGEYDIILRIESDSFKKIREIILSKIRSIDGIIDTTTLLSVEDDES